MPGSVYGYVVRAEDEAPVEHATVLISKGPERVPELMPVTDNHGRFMMDGLRSGQWVLSVRGTESESTMATVHVFNNALTVVTIELRGRRGRNIAPEPALVEEPRPQYVEPIQTERPQWPAEKEGPAMVGSVRGTVVRARSSAPVADAAIVVVRGPGPAPDISPLTGEDGTFVLDGLPEGQWVLRATSPDGESGGGTVRVSPGSVSTLRIILGR